MLLLVAAQISNQFSLLFLTGKFAHLKDVFVDILTAVSPNDEDPVAPSSLEAMHVVLVCKHARVRLKLLTSRRPADKSILFELFQREINRLVQRLLTIEGLRAHVEDQSHVLVVVHVADLLGGGHSDLEWSVHLEESGDA